MSAPAVAACIGCLQCGATCGRCASASHRQMAGSALLGVTLTPTCSAAMSLMAGKDGKRILEPADAAEAGAESGLASELTTNKRKRDDRSTGVDPGPETPATTTASRDGTRDTGSASGQQQIQLTGASNSGSHTKETRLSAVESGRQVLENGLPGEEPAFSATANGVDIKPTSTAEVNYSDTDMDSNGDAYSDISDISDLDTAEDSLHARAYADGDDSASEFEDDRSAVSGMTVASTCSLTPSLVGETLGGISLTEVPPPPADTKLPALSFSQFPHVPPTLNFCQYNEKTEDLPDCVKRLLRWRLSTITPQLIRQTVSNSGLRLTRKTPAWVGTWGKHMKSECFKAVRDFQKVNHFPGTFQIGRKDRLWRNISCLQLKFGKNDFGFVPRTYVLPGDLKELKMAWRRDGGKRKWIVKPPASARGIGIRVIQQWSQLPKKRQLIVQRYVSRPYLIDGRKFDLRIYVYVTSFSPLRVYIYEDGLVRFASVKYSNVGKSLADRFMHLTNYSINKNSAEYQPNSDAELCQGHKWTLRAFWTFMRERGVDTDALWRRIVDMVLKTLISGEHHIHTLARNNVVSNYCCHELFGFDVLLDEKLRPWLLEVNISPSLHSTAPVDLSVKGPMVRDVFNMAGVHIPNRLPAAQQAAALSQLAASADRLVLDKRLYTSVCSPQERARQIQYSQMDRQTYLPKILESLTPDDVRHLIRSEDEYSRRGGFVRVFPTASTHHYHQFFEKSRYYNQLLDAWEVRYGGDRAAGRRRLSELCQRQYHLIVPKNYLRKRVFSVEVVAAAEKAREAAQQAASAKNPLPSSVRSTAGGGAGSAAMTRTVSSDSGLGSQTDSSSGSVVRPRLRTARPLVARPGSRARRPARPGSAQSQPHRTSEAGPAVQPASVQLVNELGPPPPTPLLVDSPANRRPPGS